MIASMVAERRKVAIESILLHGYVHDNLYDIVQWQIAGNGLFISMIANFDTNEDRVISKEEYQSSAQKAAIFRKHTLQDTDFHAFDTDGDSTITVEDIHTLREPIVKLYSEKVRDGDDLWLRGITPVQYSTQWLKEHFATEPNKTRLLRVDLPIYIFHGTDDAACDVQGVYDLQERFEICNKSNLSVFVFEGHDHDLNFVEILTKKEWSAAYQALFKCAGEQVQ